MPTSNLMTDDELKLAIEEVIVREVGILSHVEKRVIEPLFSLFSEIVAERVRVLEEALEAFPCHCYEVPTLAPTDVPTEHICSRCTALAAAATPDETE